MDETAGKTKLPLKALVAEDDVVSRMLLGEILKKSNITVDFARNGKEAVDKVRQDNGSIDFILMVLKMPIMNGYEATIAIRELGFTKPIIAQTAYASQDDKEKVLAGGFDAYLSKPVKKDVLLSLLDVLG
jgi:CheY-like chemotaxis protein